MAPGVATGDDTDGQACFTAVGLPGATYDVTKSAFAFGGTPTEEDESGFVRWTGNDGALAIWNDGSELGIMNAGARETNLPDWSTDPAALTAHVIAYFGTMGLAMCQVATSSSLQSVGAAGTGTSGAVVVAVGGTTVTLARAVSGIPVVESLADARFDSEDQTTSEALYWPTIPSDVVSTAITFNAVLADPTQLAAYKAKLPSYAQGDGRVVIHHTSAGSTAPFASAATYDVAGTGNASDEDLSFDPNGNSVPGAW